MKTTIHERCPHCGARNAWLEGDHVLVGHRCYELSGPPSPSSVYSADQVCLKRGDWTADELREQLDEAFAALSKARVRANLLNLRLDRVAVAMNGYGPNGRAR